MAINFNPFQFPQMREFKKPTTIADALKDAQPLVTSTLNDVRAYREQQDRRKTFNEAMEGDRVGYEWYDENDPAHKAMVDEWVRSGNAGNILNQRNMYAANKKAADDAENERKRLVRSKQLDFEDAMSGFRAQKESNYTPDELVALGDKGQSAKRIIAELSDMGVDTSEYQKQWDEINSYKKAKAQESVEEQAEAAAVEELEKDIEAEKLEQAENARKERDRKRKENIPAAKAEFKTLSPAQQKRVKDAGVFKHGGFQYKYSEVK